jgi:murein L,D-transpeptidase YafK
MGIGMGFKGLRWLVVLAAAASSLVMGNERDRVANAREAQGEIVRQRARKAGFQDLPRYLYLRAFKHEGVLELWGSEQRGAKYRLIHTYPIAAQSGELGPKRQEGDRQVPEGLYRVVVFNPNSAFHLSLGLDYPNASDRIRSDKKKPGGDIYIHGGAASIGCLAMTDDAIQEIYLFALAAKPNGIPVHIFPLRLTPQALSGRRTHPAAALWSELEPAYRSFEVKRLVPRFTVAKDGAYVVKE